MELASFHITATGAVTAQNTRLIGIVAVGGAALSSVALKDGGSSGTTLVTLDIPAGTGQTVQIALPYAGIRFKSGMYATVTGSPTGITFFTEGNA